jgi:hypothetical protein
MTMSRSWELAIARFGSAAFASPLARIQHDKRRHAKRQLRMQYLQAWEDEGGSLAAPVSRGRHSPVFHQRRSI